MHPRYATPSPKSLTDFLAMKRWQIGGCTVFYNIQWHNDFYKKFSNPNQRGSKLPKARAYYRVFNLPIAEKDKEYDYSEHFGLICSILQKAQFPSILHLTPLIDSLKDLAHNHVNREISKNLIGLFSNLLSLVKSEKIVFADSADPHIKERLNLLKRFLVIFQWFIAKLCFLWTQRRNFSFISR